MSWRDFLLALWMSCICINVTARVCVCTYLNVYSCYTYGLDMLMIVVLLLATILPPSKKKKYWLDGDAMEHNDQRVCTRTSSTTNS